MLQVKPFVNRMPALAWVLFFALSVMSLPLHADNRHESPAIISIIIDDIGYRLNEARAMMHLSPALTYAILPDAPHTQQLAALAHQQGKEVMLHLPMQATTNDKAERGALTVEMSEQDVVDTMREAFAKVPNAVGMNNHQGSLLTRHPGHMAWVMTEMKKNGHYFVDSRTTSQSVADTMALEQGVPTLNRDVFLDHDIDHASIESQFNRLIALAKQRGYAVGIGHPHAETLAVLQKMLPTLTERNVQLVPVSKQLQPNVMLLTNVKGGL